MYLMKKYDLMKGIKQSYSAEIIGLDRATLNRILNKKQKCSKLVAYCITKFLDENKEIDDFFIKVD